MIRLDHVAIGFGGVPFLPPFCLEAREGDFWGIVGPNGGGKTTLVKTLLGLLPPVHGSVRLPEPKPRFGYVPQRSRQARGYPLSTFDTVLMGRYGRLCAGRRPSDEDRRRTGEELARVGLQAQARQRFDSLSGGQQQRALLARALVSDPDVLVLDEPTTGMDLPGETYVLSFLRRLHRQEGMTLLMVEHHINKVIQVADHLCLINKDAGLFAAGSLTDMLRVERLSAAYGRSVRVRHVGGTHHVEMVESSDE